MAETAEEKLAREKKERIEKLRSDPRHGDLQLMVLDIFETDVIPSFKDKPPNDGPGKNLWDYLFGDKED